MIRLTGKKQLLVAVTILLLIVSIRRVAADNGQLKPITSANAASVTLLTTLKPGLKQPNIQFNSDGSLMLIWAIEGDAQIWNLLNLKVVAHLTSYSIASDLPHNQAQFTADGIRFIVANAVERYKPNGTINPQWGQPEIWDRRSGKVAIVPTNDPTFSILASPDSQRLATVYINQADSMGVYYTAQLWDISKSTPIAIQVLVKSRDYDHVLASVPPAVAFSPDGKLLAFAGVRNDMKATILIFDASSGRLLYQFSPAGMVSTGSISFVDNQTAILCDGITWALPTGTVLSTSVKDPISEKLLPQFAPGESIIRYNADKTLALSVVSKSADGADSYGRVWDIGSTKLVSTLPTGVEFLGHIDVPVFSADSSIVVGYKDGQLHLVETSTGRDLASLGKNILYIYMSDTSSRIVSVDQKSEVQIWGVR